TAGGDEIIVQNHFDADLDEAIEEIAFADGTVLNLAGIRAKSVADQKPSGVVRGDDYADTYFHAEGDGSYLISDWDSRGRIDRLTFTDLNPDDVSFTQTSGMELVMTTAGGDEIIVQNHFDADLDEAIEEIAFADGTVLNLAGIRAKSVSDQKPSGTVTGDDFADTYFHASGDGSYTIFDWDDRGRIDRLTFTDLNAGDVNFSQTSGMELVMTTSDGEVITVNNHFASDLDEAIEEIAFADSTVLNLAGIAAKVTADFAAAADTSERALALDGLGDGVDIASVALTSEFTIEGWVQFMPGTSLTHHDSLVSGGTITQDLNFHAGKLRLYDPTVPGYYNRIIANTVLEAGEWTHVAVSRDSSDVLRIYLNGELDVTAGPYTNTFNVAEIGATDRGSTHGLLDNIRVWSVERSQAEIQSLMNVELDTTLTGLERSFSFDGTGDVVDDVNPGTPLTLPSGGMLVDSTAALGGNDENNTLIGTDGADVVAGGLGVDRLSGKAGADTFVFVDADTGVDVVTDFEFGNDVLDVSDWGATSLADLTIVSTQTGSTYEVNVSYNGEALKLTGVSSANANALAADDFLFA
ncbi:MAG: calcium-binding protein, partial [Pseudomonadota bacterium]